MNAPTGEPPQLHTEPHDAHSDGVRLAVLRVLENNPSTTQRELSRALGLSLGKTHYLLHALLDKGLVKAQNFRRSGNKLAYAYLLTPSGIRHRAALTRRFLQQKEAEFEELQRTLAQLRSELQDHH
jgi:EPS-associated MarR family transcriptional regulator